MGGSGGGGSSSDASYRSIEIDSEYKDYIENNHEKELQNIIDNPDSSEPVYFALSYDNEYYESPNGYSNINGALRGGADPSGTFKETADRMDKYIESTKIKENLELYRGMHIDGLEDIKKGDEFKPDTILSMSASKHTAETFMETGKQNENRVLITIKADKESKIAPLLFNNEGEVFKSSEKEFIGHTGNTYKITNIEKLSDNHGSYYKMEMKI